MNFTQAALDNLPLPVPGQRSTYHDEGGAQSVRGLQLRVTSNGIKTFSVFKRVAGGSPERTTLGRYPEISIDQARKKAKAVIAQLAEGQSPAAAKREDKARSMTLADAVAEYIEEKRRADGLALKQRTRDDYMDMVKPGRLTAAGRRTRGGLLAQLAGKPLRAITAADIRAQHAENLKRGERPAAYSAQVLRAVLAWHGVTIAHSPFSRETHGRDRIVIPKARVGDDAGVKALLAQLGPWWQAANAQPDADYLRFLLLTGCRPGEPLKVLVGDCDLAAGQVVLRDTKARNDHRLLLSSQALVIVKQHAEGKAPGDRLFPITGAEGNRLAHELAAITGIAVTPKNLRSAFASIAEDLVSASTLKRLMNHQQAGDVTNQHYVKKLEEQLRAGWQAVADYIEHA